MSGLPGLLVAAAAAVAPQTQPAHLEISCVPSSKVLIDGKEVGTSRFPLFLHVQVDAGKHKLACQTLDGRTSPDEEFTVGPGETKVFRRRVQ
jgi:hypothetical protein